ncbi:hypothetical protein BABINDRAFT_169616 [Babjeviella inositovora NRRL Y-12698]|uniref:DUF218 domain-containing protein n=1 Tax=Babjeviella inositovora NRRL Y-12698 TaxID=984486 RepID=A0A1E3QWY8_9ASCO|nr:uncharacterized protein BABINDRAFT_169616 [Babjeviella inositovora NRRL Y-12698]ODQ82176.1 hypothetical protein BABINDRAFT_169616 [Babjeviella inositovora NRRL Y-12698]
MKGISHLILVPGHSIWKPSSSASLGASQDEWYLEGFQKDGRDHMCFVNHIVSAIHILIDEWDTSMVIFSGGQTKIQAGPISESQSYRNLAERLLTTGAYAKFKETLGSDHGMLTESELGKFTNENPSDQYEHASLMSRIYTEEFARDSFENVVLSLLRFKQITGTYPQKLTIVGFEFKRARFVDHHLSTLGFPAGRVQYIGNSPTPPIEDDREYFRSLRAAECKNAVSLFMKDLWGCAPPLLDKKSTRDPFNRGYGLTAQATIRLSPFLITSLEALEDKLFRYKL